MTCLSVFIVNCRQPDNDKTRDDKERRTDALVSDIAVFVLKRGVKLQPTNL